ncbi:sugar ABC transporter permease [Vallitalea pronyensis]|uniref:Sugar ABC transporter permease n=1 Tax=Vallitalea pronyensis TaxID=1348613 RepID=A0A8J8MNU8_9FIRM|nr:ABC transporter permease subunit [Vallitalea pronyensis]QUI25250.1 sugar ABC transporter permease [Vallitalea pronyensis]
MAELSKTVKLEKTKHKKTTIRAKIAEDFKKHRTIYIMVIPVLLYYLIFHYGPMFGIVIAFKDYRPGRGIWGSDWVGMKHFIDFLTSQYFWRLVKNTLFINFYNLLIGFPAPIILALLLNEVRSRKFKRTVQTVTYMPHFISAVVVAGIIVDLVGTDGLINDLLAFIGFQRKNLLAVSALFRPIFVGSNIWQNIGWGTIIYLAALSGINPNLYEAADIDGAGRFKKIWHVTLPGIAPTITILLIMRIGRMMHLGWEKIILLYNPIIYDTADVISTFVYRRGLEEADFSYSTAVGLFNAIINFSLLIMANKVSKKLSETSLW